MAATVGLLAVESVAAGNARRLSGGQIRATLAGMQLTDEVHELTPVGLGGSLDGIRQRADDK